ncbi:MAG: histidinol dehydrogenase [Deltaproteobacteria bacterium]|nr:histidinol dehydrogenase [Deltaproteobacteria bacterium]MBW1958353.1 histidinol dehydrogenase [Deltaproteobacteria bacterium]MBW2014186.1 histidinol dehydrogenase [Deltaproteobacteria bacterium]MBW2089536.1 histidinol dehydrogenase [Deltaproteobacteria bacterium]MBW2320605.1 histidinol dehydrogenase [Deltaproteobacteria bacterium]
MKIYNYPSKSAKKRIASIANRGLGFKKKDVLSVTRILEDVRKNGDKTLIEYSNRFDSPELTITSIKATREEIDTAAKRVDRSFVRALNRAIKQIQGFHKQQFIKSWINTKRPGTLLGQMVNPVDSAGVYVPGGMGGKTPLVSSVLMGVIPAKVAGVKHIAMVTPPNRDGKVNPHLLTAAKKVGVDSVYKVGSAWAIAALAYGTETIPKVDVIVGPGNIYVTIAKKIVAGTVGIDMIAGPSEILVIADSTANPEYIAADLLSQAEHDILSSAILVTNSKATAKAVALAVDKKLEALKRKEIAEKSMSSFGAIIVVPDIDAAVELSNRIAPEHLEIQIKDPFAVIGQIRNAGAVFLGDYTPEPVGDYIAGPNHVLPTAGTARFSSALSVDNFVKKTSLIHYSKQAFEREAGDIIRLAEIEGLDAHANAVKIRLDRFRK